MESSLVSRFFFCVCAKDEWLNLKRVLEGSGEWIWKHIEWEEAGNELCPFYSIVVYK